MEVRLRPEFSIEAMPEVFVSENRLRDEARETTPQLGLEDEFEAFNELVGTLLGARDAEAKGAVGKARAAGKPFDPERVRLPERAS